MAVLPAATHPPACELAYYEPFGAIVSLLGARGTARTAAPRQLVSVAAPNPNPNPNPDPDPDPDPCLPIPLPLPLSLTLTR